MRVVAWALALLALTACDKCGGDSVTLDAAAPKTVVAKAAEVEVVDVVGGGTMGPGGVPHAVYKQAVERARKEVTYENARHYLDQMDEQIEHERDVTR